MPESVSRQSFGLTLFNLVSKAIVSSASPRGETVTGNEMRAAVAALSVDGFSTGDRSALKKRFESAKLDLSADALYTKLTRAVDVLPSYRSGTYQKLSGRLEVPEPVFTIGGESPPSGYYLKLDSPILVDGRKTTSIYLGGESGQIGTRSARAGDKLLVHGRLDLGTYGGVETPRSSYVKLSGVSNLAAGEPRFNGLTFVDDMGSPMTQLHASAPLVADAPSTVAVLDTKNHRAFVGKHGGFIPPAFNPFHGFSSIRKIENATAKDERRAVRGQDGTVRDLVTGKELRPAGSEPQNRAWFYNDDTQSLYRLGGQVDRVIHFGRGDVIGH